MGDPNSRTRADSNACTSRKLWPPTVTLANIRSLIWVSQWVLKSRVVVANRELLTLLLPVTASATTPWGKKLLKRLSMKLCPS